MQCLSQAVVCISTPRMYPRSGYFLVKAKVDFALYLLFLVEAFPILTLSVFKCFLQRINKKTLRIIFLEASDIYIVYFEQLFIRKNITLRKTKIANASLLKRKLLYEICFSKILQFCSETTFVRQLGVL